MTADELFRLPDDGHRYALVRGELQPRHLAEGDTLDGAPLLPRFRLPVEEVFALQPAATDHRRRACTHPTLPWKSKATIRRAGGESRARDKEKR